MTMDDAFDQRLKAAFAAAKEPLEQEAEADAFAHKVVQRLGNPNRKRALALGGAGSAGSAIAGTQLETIMAGVNVPSEGLWNNLAFLMTPETMAAGAMAIAVATVAIVLPRRIIG